MHMHTLLMIIPKFLDHLLCSLVSGRGFVTLNSIYKSLNHTHWLSKVDAPPVLESSKPCISFHLAVLWILSLTLTIRRMAQRLSWLLQQLSIETGSADMDRLTFSWWFFWGRTYLEILKMCWFLSWPPQMASDNIDQILDHIVDLKVLRGYSCQNQSLDEAGVLQRWYLRDSLQTLMMLTLPNSPPRPTLS